MSIYVKDLAIRTSSGGADTAHFRGRGILHAVEVIKGTLSTPDIDITDEPSGRVLLSVNGVAADTYYTLVAKAQDSTGADADNDGGDVFVAPVVSGEIQVAVTGGGDTLSGTVRLILER